MSTLNLGIKMYKDKDDQCWSCNSCLGQKNYVFEPVRTDDEGGVWILEKIPKIV
jgi:hypothetical protein